MAEAQDGFRSPDSPGSLNNSSRSRQLDTTADPRMSLMGNSRLSRPRSASPDGHTAMVLLQYQVNCATDRLATAERDIRRLLKQGNLKKHAVNEELAKLEKADHGQQKSIGALDARLEDLKDDMAENHADFAAVASTVRTNRHKVDHATTLASRTTGKVNIISGVFMETKTDVRTEFERFARSLQSLSTELHAVRQDHGALADEVATARERDFARNTARGGTFTQCTFEEVLQRLEDSLKTQRKLLCNQEHLEKQFSSCVVRGELTEISDKCDGVDARGRQLEKYVTDQIFSMKKEKTARLLQSWNMENASKNRKMLLTASWGSWRSYIDRRRRLQEALSRTKQQHAKAHVQERVRTWWYNMQKDTQERQFSQLSEDSHHQAAQLELLLASSARQEKAAAEQARQVANKLTLVDRTLETLEQKKADRSALEASNQAFDMRLQKEFNIVALQRGFEECQAELRNVASQKLDIEQAERDKKTSDKFTKDVRSMLKHHEDRLECCALRDQVELKADSRLVEEVFTLLAKQADQLANLLACDLEKIRKAMTRFLELSPDIRKAALSLGIVAAEGGGECVGCRAQPGERTGTGAMIGADGVCYKLGANTATTPSAQTQNVLAETLGLPAVLTSSLAAGGRPLTPVASPLEQAEQVQACQQQQHQQLKQFLQQDSGWMSGSSSRPGSRLESRPASQASCTGAAAHQVLEDATPTTPVAVPPSFFPAVASGQQPGSQTARQPLLRAPMPSVAKRGSTPSAPSAAAGGGPVGRRPSASGRRPSATMGAGRSAR